MHVDAMCTWIDDDCALTLKAMKARVYDKFRVTVCEKTVDNSISSFCYTLKRATVVPVRWNGERSLETRYDYSVRFMRILSSTNEDHIFFVDEVSLNVSMRSKRGRSLVGSPTAQVVPAIRSRNISVYCITNFVSQTTVFKTMTFYKFIHNLLAHTKTSNITKAVLVMDNVPFHKHRSIKEKFKESDHIFTISQPH